MNNDEAVFGADFKFLMAYPTKPKDKKAPASTRAPKPTPVKKGGTKK